MRYIKTLFIFMVLFTLVSCSEMPSLVPTRLNTGDVTTDNPTINTNLPSFDIDSLSIDGCNELSFIMSIRQNGIEVGNKQIKLNKADNEFNGVKITKKINDLTTDSTEFYIESTEEIVVSSYSIQFKFDKDYISYEAYDNGVFKGRLTQKGMSALSINSDSAAFEIRCNDNKLDTLTVIYTTPLGLYTTWTLSLKY